MYTETYNPNRPEDWISPTNRSVLVVEDDAAIRESLSSVLLEEGYAVYEAGNGLEALELLIDKRLRPNLILLDMVMPLMGGADFLAAMEKEPELSGLPIALLSATKLEKFSQRASISLAKPIEIEELISVVHRVANGTPAATSSNVSC